jgi:hypothetical protein
MPIKNLIAVYYTVGTWATFTSPAYMNSKIAVRCWKQFAFLKINITARWLRLI